jgi:hypothetical protein
MIVVYGKADTQQLGRLFPWDDVEDSVRWALQST